MLFLKHIYKFHRYCIEKESENCNLNQNMINNVLFIEGLGGIAKVQIICTWVVS